MEIRLRTVGSCASKDTCESNGRTTGALDSKRFAHHRAAAAQYLEVGHGSAARRGIAGGSGRKSAESGGRGLLEKWTHGPRLIEKGLHGERENSGDDIQWTKARGGVYGGE